MWWSNYFQLRFFCLFLNFINSVNCTIINASYIIIELSCVCNFQANSFQQYAFRNPDEPGLHRFKSWPYFCCCHLYVHSATKWVQQLHLAIMRLRISSRSRTSLMAFRRTKNYMLITSPTLPGTVAESSCVKPRLRASVSSTSSSSYTKLLKNNGLSLFSASEFQPRSWITSWSMPACSCPN